MYELIQMTDHDYYIDCPARIGLVRLDETDVVLIDSGSDKDAGKKVLRILEANRWRLRAIFNTHSHADHIGGNRLLQDRTGCAVYARGLECVYTNDPCLEPATLYGGLPFRELRNKFLMAKESAASPLTEDVLPAGIRLLALPGHSFDMVGFLTPEGTAYIADCVSSEETLAKYGIGYLWDVEASLATLAALKGIPARRFVPSHAPVTEEIGALAARNEEAIRAVKRRILALCAPAVSFEELLKQLFDGDGLQMTAQQYALVGSTLRSYLSSMYDHGELTVCFRDNRMLWAAAEPAG